MFDFVSLVKLSWSESQDTSPEIVLYVIKYALICNLCRPLSKFSDRVTLCLDMDDTLTLMLFEELRIGSETVPYDTMVRALDDPDDCGMVYFRPYLKTFLHAVSLKFEVVVFTAACQEYADQILDAIDPTRTLIHHRLYRDSCLECTPNPEAPDSKVYLKDLRVLGRDLSQVILVDNSLLCFACQLDNGIVCNPFKGNRDDSELITILQVLNIVNQYPKIDVRKLFRKMYGLTRIIEEYSQKGGRKGVRALPFEHILDSSSLCGESAQYPLTGKNSDHNDLLTSSLVRQ